MILFAGISAEASIPRRSYSDEVTDKIHFLLLGGFRLFLINWKQSLSTSHCSPKIVR